MEDQIQRYEEIRKLFPGADKAVLHSDEYDKNRAFGIGIIIFMSSAINQGLLGIVKELREHDPHHLYVQENLFHVTLRQLSVLSEGSNTSIYDNYIRRINSAVKEIKPFEITIKGINNFPNAVFAQVFSSGNKLYHFHDILKKAFPKVESVLEFVPHVTIAKFRCKPERLLKAAARFENTNFGKQIVDKIALVKCRLPFRGDHYEVMKTFGLGTDSRD